MSETAAENPPPTETTPSPAPAETPAEPTVLTATEPSPEPAALVPEKYEFTPPEVDGKPVPVDAEALKGFEDVARQAGLTQAQFEAVTRAGVERIAALTTGPLKAYTDMQRAWTDEIKADPEIGGDKLQPALAQASRALDKFGGADLRRALDLTGAGNHPAVVRAFIQIGRAMGDGEGFVTGKPAGSSAPMSLEDRAARLYRGTRPSEAA